MAIKLEGLKQRIREDQVGSVLLREKNLEKELKERESKVKRIEEDINRVRGY